MTVYQFCYLIAQNPGEFNGNLNSITSHRLRDMRKSSKNISNRHEMLKRCAELVEEKDEQEADLVEME